MQTPSRLVTSNLCCVLRAARLIVQACENKVWVSCYPVFGRHADVSAESQVLRYPSFAIPQRHRTSDGISRQPAATEQRFGLRVEDMTVNARIAYVSPCIESQVGRGGPFTDTEVMTDKRIPLSEIRR